MKRKFVFAALVAVLGLLLGYIAKATDSISLIGAIGTDLGTWVFILTLITAYSFTPFAAAINAPVFFLSMLTSYYLYGQLVLGFFPKAYFTGWLIVSLLSPIGGFLVWLSKGKGWVANICAALPVSILFASGYPAFYTLSISRILDIVFAVILLIILPKTIKGKIVAFGLAFILAFAIAKLRLLSYLPW